MQGSTERTDRQGSRALGQAGSSIIELVSAIGFLLTLGFIAQPRVSVMIDSMSLNGTARQVLGELRKARAEAIMRNTRCRVSLDEEGELAIYRYRTAELRWEETPTGTTRPGEGESLSVDATGDIVFAPNGTAPTQATIVVRAPDGRSRSIVVGPAGTMRIL